ncbi:HD domain-containing protein [Baekduia alba]|uniref:HD domain-containing protein n=1 Tax=Baekduia alba TaxID=2997333 RepID=UPI002341047D|nr:HD domain-containing protein [Baekduia alba]
MPDYPSFVSGLPITEAALEFAAGRHAGQLRDVDHAPFILHPLEVAHLLQGRDYPDHVIAAGVLHDVLEDTDVTREELEERFGAEVADLVAAVSEPPAAEGTYAERKARLRDVVAGASTDAAAVFAADKVAKAREFRLGLVSHGDSAAAVDRDKLDHYWACLALLERRLGPQPLVRQLRFELEALALLPPSMGQPADPSR